MRNAFQLVARAEAVKLGPFERTRGQADGLAPPRGVVLRPQQLGEPLPPGQSAEWYYAELVEKLRQEQEKERQEQKRKAERGAQGDSEVQTLPAGQDPKPPDKAGDIPAPDHSPEHEPGVGSAAERGAKEGSADDSGESRGGDGAESGPAQAGPRSQPADAGGAPKRSSASGRVPETPPQLTRWEQDVAAAAARMAETFGELQPFPADSPEAAEQAEREWKESAAACLLDKTCGSGAGDALSGALSNLVLPVCDPAALNLQWVAELAEFMSELSPGGQNYSRPSWRHAWMQARQGVQMPCNRQRGAGLGLLIVDTSGSMSDAECNLALGTVEKILQRYPESRVKLVSCDTAVIEGQEYTPADFAMREWEGWKGRGGTDLNPTFRFALQMHARPDWILVLTDLCWDYAHAPNPRLPPSGWARRWPACIRPGLRCPSVSMCNWRGSRRPRHFAGRHRSRIHLDDSWPRADSRTADLQVSDSASANATSLDGRPGRE